MKILTRAKSLCSDEYLISDSVMYKHNNLYLKVKGKWRECDETTMSLNFEDMLDSQGNKIFASLSEDGKGGDITQDSYVETDYSFVNRISDGMWMQTININTISQRSYDRNNFYPTDIEVIGIQE